MLSYWTDLDRAFPQFDELRRRMDRVMDEYSTNHPTSSLSPRITIQENPDAFLLRAELPGFTEKDILLEVQHEMLSLRGERRNEIPEGFQLVRRERPSVKFSRSIGLPARVDPDRATAVLKDGVLSITLPRAADTQARTIDIKAG